MLHPAIQMRSGRSGGWLRDQVGNDLLRQEIEHLRIAEEAGDIDEQVLGKQVELACVAPQQFEIPIHVIGLDRRHRHAPLDPALQRARLVEREIVGGLRAQKIDDLGQPILCRILRHASRSACA